KLKQGRHRPAPPTRPPIAWTVVGRPGGGAGRCRSTQPQTTSSHRRHGRKRWNGAAYSDSGADMATATSAASAREILTGLHDVMASKLGAQAKLNKVVRIIAEAMASEVCSIYLLRDGVLELFATVGLNQEAVHVT